MLPFLYTQLYTHYVKPDFRVFSHFVSICITWFNNAGHLSKVALLLCVGRLSLLPAEKVCTV